MVQPLRDRTISGSTPGIRRIAGTVTRYTRPRETSMQAAAVSLSTPRSAPPAASREAAIPWEGLRLGRAEGILTLGDANTTVAYCRFDEEGEVEYLFVASRWRRRGVARWLLGQVAACVCKPLRFREPLSPLGQRLVAAWEAHPRNAPD